MKFNFKGVTYAYYWLNQFDKTRPTLLCLHGFTGSSATFKGLAQALNNYNLLAVDIIGHGQSSIDVHPYRYQMESVVQDLKQLTKSLGLTQFSLLGYSMGGRLALSFGLTYPEVIAELILVSSSPGLISLREQKNRRRSDWRLAQKLINEPLVDFINYWQELPLFTSQKRLSEMAQQILRQERLAQNKLGLALSLIGMGTGQQKKYWPALANFNHVPTLLITGEEDLKFGQIAEKMQASQPNFSHLVIPEAGHALHLEQPDLFSHGLKKWLKDERS